MSESDEMFSEEEQTEIYGSDSYLHNKAVLSGSAPAVNDSFQFSEILIFDRALKKKEIVVVEDYMYYRYFNPYEINWKTFLCVVLGSFALSIATIILASQ